jgi:hypothetical protein
MKDVKQWLMPASVLGLAVGLMALGGAYLWGGEHGHSTSERGADLPGILIISLS